VRASSLWRSAVLWCAVLCCGQTGEKQRENTHTKLFFSNTRKERELCFSREAFAHFFDFIIFEKKMGNDLSRQLALKRLFQKLDSGISAQKYSVSRYTFLFCFRFSIALVLCEILFCVQCCFSFVCNVHAPHTPKLIFPTLVSLL
jgi:hypothetical protein